MLGLVLRVQGLVLGLVFRVQGSEFRAKVLEFRVWG